MNPGEYPSQYSDYDYPDPPSSSFYYAGSVNADSDGYASSHESPTFEYQSSSRLEHSISLPSPLDSMALDFYEQDAPLTLSPQNENIVVAISTSFHPGSQPAPDTILSSTDGVLFYVHFPSIETVCPGAFQPYTHISVSAEQFTSFIVISVDAPSSHLNIILHALHSSSPAANSPDFDTLSASIDRMPMYNIVPQRFICPSRPIYDLLLTYAPLKPLELYALGAHHNIQTLAITSSSHLLTYELSNISDQMATHIGPIYLKRLFLLRHNREASLRNIMLHPPFPHPPTKQCGFESQRQLTRAWALVIAHFAWESNLDISTTKLNTVLSPLADPIDCETCQHVFQDKIKTVVAQWASVKHTI